MTTQTTQPQWYTLADLMSRWHVSRSTIYRLIDQGRLRRRHIGGQVRFAAADVASFEGNTER